MATKLAFGSITGAYASVPQAGSGDQVYVLSTLNQDVKISFSAVGSDMREVLIPVEAGGVMLPFNSKVFAGTDISIKHLGTAPTSGNISISAFNSML
jgi:hypothetical protein